MTDTKFTPGPWVATRNSSYWKVAPENRRPTDPFEIGDVCSSDPENPDAGLQEANARLVAAAPELLLSLEELLNAYSKSDESLCCDGRDCGCMGSTVHQQAEHYARVAVAKARGAA